MSPRNRAALSVAASMTGLVVAGSAHAQAFYLQEQSTRAAGRAFSGETADTGAASPFSRASRRDASLATYSATRSVVERRPAKAGCSSRLW